MEVHMKKTLNFSVSIQCPRRMVWDTMLGLDGYKVWTAAFCEGSYFSGSWAEGQKIRFLSPGGDGMIAVIAENRPYDHVSVRHIGEISGGVEDTTSTKVQAWAPAYENYTFVESGDGTEVTVSLDTASEWEQYMLDTYPKALVLLKNLCESKAKGGA
jgi:hypothetical protein